MLRPIQLRSEARARSVGDVCSGVQRPLVSEDGAQACLRLVGGVVTLGSLRQVLRIAAVYGDGRVRLDDRQHLQLRGLPRRGGRLEEHVTDALEATGLIPTHFHELVRNVVASPLTGRSGGRIDLGRLAAALDAGLRADYRLAELSPRFVFSLDDGRGDLLEHPCDLGIVALDPGVGQLRIGTGWGPVIPLAGAATTLLDLARRFLHLAGRDWGGPPRHVAELRARLPGGGADPDPALPEATGPPAFGPVVGARLCHVDVPSGLLDEESFGEMCTDPTAAEDDEVIVTPWHSALVPTARALRPLRPPLLPRPRRG